MMFEVFKGKSRMFWNEKCKELPPAEHLRQLLNAGYVVKIDGKVWKPKKRGKDGA